MLLSEGAPLSLFVYRFNPEVEQRRTSGVAGARE